VLALAGCVPGGQREYETAQAEAASGQFKSAVGHYDKILIRFSGEEVSLRAAREAARISFYDTKDFKKAVGFFKYIVLYSNDASERDSAQKQIADIYFTQLNDYPKAVIEINKVLTITSNPTERAKYKINLAKAYYYQNNFAQAENEVDEFLRATKDEKLRFDLTMLKGNIALAKKDLTKATEIYKEVMRVFPDRAQRENVALTLAVCYEELKDFKNAMATLEILKKTHPVPEYIDVRIKRLLERQKNAPGAKGMRK
jgi:lipopolysaccharide biosynthesis regulator YciM